MSGYLGRFIKFVDKKELDYYALVVEFEDGGREYVTEAWSTTEAKALAEATAFQMAKGGHAGFSVLVLS